MEVGVVVEPKRAEGMVMELEVEAGAEVEVEVEAECGEWRE